MRIAWTNNPAVFSMFKMDNYQIYVSSWLGLAVVCFCQINMHEIDRFAILFLYGQIISLYSWTKSWKREIKQDTYWVKRLKKDDLSSFVGYLSFIWPYIVTRFIHSPENSMWLVNSNYMQRLHVWRPESPINGVT